LTLSQTEKRLLGYALHIIQDNVVHKGTRWADDPWYVSPAQFFLTNVLKTNVLSNFCKCNEHPDVACTVGTDSETAYDHTLQVLDRATLESEGEKQGPPNQPIQ